MCYTKIINSQNIKLLLSISCPNYEYIDHKYLAKGKMNLIYRILCKNRSNSSLISLILRIRYYENHDFSQPTCTETKIQTLLESVGFNNYAHIFCEDTTKTKFPFVYSFLEDIRGENLSTENSIEEFFSLGKTLNQIHSIKGKNFGYIGYDDRTYKEYYTYYYTNAINLISKYDIELAQLFKKILSDNSSCLEDNHQKPVLLHGDLHQGNILINNSTPYLIDWESARFGIKEYDLIKIKYFLFLNLNDEKIKDFLNGYSYISENSFGADLLLYELCWLIRMYIFEKNSISIKGSIYPNQYLYLQNIKDICTSFSKRLNIYNSNNLGFWKGIAK